MFYFNMITEKKWSSIISTPLKLSAAQGQIIQGTQGFSQTSLVPSLQRSDVTLNSMVRGNIFTCRIPLAPCRTVHTLATSLGNGLIVCETCGGKHEEWEGELSCLMLELFTRTRRSVSAKGLVFRSCILLRWLQDKAPRNDQNPALLEGSGI